MRELAQKLTYREYRKDEIVYAFGDEPDNFYIVLDG